MLLPSKTKVIGYKQVFWPCSYILLPLFCWLLSAQIALAAPANLPQDKLSQRSIIVTESDGPSDIKTKYRSNYANISSSKYQPTNLQLKKTWLDMSFIERSFYEVALKNEYDTIDHPLRKWRKPIRIFLVHDVKDKKLHTELAHKQVAHLRQITGHSIRFVPHRHQANLTWVFSSEARWEQQVEKYLGKPSTKYLSSAVCIANYRARKNGEIIKASIVIPVDKARHRGKLIACVVEEVAQILGLPNDSDNVYPSVFNDHSPEELLSPLDITLLKLLYEPSLKVGMRQNEIKPILTTLLRQYQRSGQLKKSEQISKQAPLYLMLNGQDF